MQDQKNILITVLTCVAIWMGFELWIRPTPKKSSTTEIVQGIPLSPSPSLPDVPAYIEETEALNNTPRVAVENTLIRGSINLLGGSVDAWKLLKYEEEGGKKDPVSLLHPWITKNGYQVAFPWIGDASVELPGETTVWRASAPKLTQNQPVTLSWTNAKGVVFQHILSLDKAYMLKVTHRVYNPETNSPIMVGAKTVIKRRGPVKTGGYMMLQEGPLGVFSGRLKEFSYDKIAKIPFSQAINAEKKQGWMGLTDKYWLVALTAKDAEQAGFHGKEGIAPHSSIYHADVFMPYEKLEPGKYYEHSSGVFLGPKRVDVLKAYEQEGIHHFHLAVDFGWFYFLTKPMLMLLSWLNSWLGNFGLSLLVMTVFVKAIFFPLSLKSFRSMARIRLLQPKVQHLKAQFSQDTLRLNQEIIALYRKEKVSPMSGLLPMLVQIPVFFSLYKVLFISIEMRHAPFYGWIQDLSAPDPSSVFTFFGLLPWTPPQWLTIGIWPVAMGITMILQQMMNQTLPLDKQQRVMFTYIMPIIFTVMLAKFPAGLVIYWTWSNCLTLLQQWWMTRRMKESHGGASSGLKG